MTIYLLACNVQDWDGILKLFTFFSDLGHGKIGNPWVDVGSLWTPVPTHDLKFNKSEPELLANGSSMDFVEGEPELQIQNNLHKNKIGKALLLHLLMFLLKIAYFQKSCQFLKRIPAMRNCIIWLRKSNYNSTYSVSLNVLHFVAIYPFLFQHTINNKSDGTYSILQIPNSPQNESVYTSFSFRFHVNGLFCHIRRYLPPIVNHHFRSEVHQKEPETFWTSKKSETEKK